MLIRIYGQVATSINVYVIVHELARAEVVFLHHAYISQVGKDKGPVNIFPFFEKVGIFEKLERIIVLRLIDASSTLLDKRVYQLLFVCHLIEEVGCFNEISDLLLSWDAWKLLCYLRTVHQKEGWCF